MILKSNNKQFKLSEDGQIAWQRDETNPMPGIAVATLKKGSDVLVPEVVLIDDAKPLDGVDKGEALTLIQNWLAHHIQEILAPLFNLKNNTELSGVPAEIVEKLYNAFGILPREDLESLITQMDETQRASLRGLKIRFGPLLVFLPELNKPVAVKLRALLIILSQDKPLPAEVPADGIVSFSVADKNVDADYYRSIGYPVYGPRSIRVDMLDRVVCAVYDSADKGEFKAEHKMAEWLGSNIADLYAVLEAMGHVKVKDPADEKVEVTEKPETAESEVKETEAPKEAEITEEPKAEATAAKPVEQAKPELATFRLKRGKAINSNQNDNGKKFEKKFGADKKKFSSSSKPKYNKKKSGPKKEPRERVYVAEAKVEADNPFAILEQLKSGNKDS